MACAVEAFRAFEFSKPQVKSAPENEKIQNFYKGRGGARTFLSAASRETANAATNAAPRRLSRIAADRNVRAPAASLHSHVSALWIRVVVVGCDGLSECKRRACG